MVAKPAVEARGRPLGVVVWAHAHDYLWIQCVHKYVVTSRGVILLPVTTARGRGRPPIPPDRIVAAALTIVDEDGADALSMRNLAQRLESGTATLYRHFGTRTELIAHVVDRVFGEVEFDEAQITGDDWGQACVTLAQNLFDVLKRHRNVAPLLVEQVPTGPNAMIHRERCIAVLLHSGFPPPLAARSYTTLVRFVLGFAMQFAGAGSSADLDLSAVFHGLDPASFPATVAVADALPVSLDDEFAFGLELILAGLAQLHRRS